MRSQRQSHEKAPDVLYPPLTQASQLLNCFLLLALEDEDDDDAEREGDAFFVAGLWCCSSLVTRLSSA